LVDIAATGRVETEVIARDGADDFVGTLHDHMIALGDMGSWTADSLIVWLDRRIGHQDIPLAESAEFLRQAIRGLMTRLGITDVDVLALDRFRLRDAIEARIQQHRDRERQAAFQALLLPDSALTLRDEFAIDFSKTVYEPGWTYEGGFQFRKHYFGPKPGELSETTAGGAPAEEFQCAQHIDGLAEVKYWVRNLLRKRSSFRLQTSKDLFYPDFVCQLMDGRILVVEYKGGHLYTAEDAEEKRTIGAVWESRSGGRCLFVMPTAGDFSVIDSKIRAG
jgi:type III restriction enzyme